MNRIVKLSEARAMAAKRARRPARSAPRAPESGRPAPPDPNAIQVTIPIRTGLGLNDRGCWQARARRVKRERQVTLRCLVAQVHWAAKSELLHALEVGGRLEVHLERVSPRQCDGDNIQGSLKSIRDEIARWLGIDDGDPRVRWMYSQSRGDFAVRVTIQPIAPRQESS